MLCNKCGAENDSLSKFCESCGEELVSGTEQISAESTAETSEEETKSVNQDILNEEVSTSANSDNLNLEQEVRSSEEPKKQKKGIVILIAVLVIVAIAAVSYSKTKQGPSRANGKALVSALNKTFDKIEEELDVANKSDYKDEVSQSIKLNLDSVNVPDDEFFGEYVGSEINLETAASNLQKEAQAKFSLLLSSGKTFSVDCKLDDEELLIGLPEFLDKALVMPSKNFGTTYDASALSSSYYSLGDDFSLAFSDISNIFFNRQKGLSIETIEELRSALLTLTSTVQVNSVDKKEIDLNKKVNADRYNIELSQNELKAFLIDVITAFENDSTLKGIPSFDEMLDELREEVKELPEHPFVEEDAEIATTIDIYVYDNEVVMFSMGHEEFNFEIKFNDLKSLIKDFNLNLYSYGNEVKLAIKYDDNSTDIEFYTGDGYFVNINANISAQYNDNNSKWDVSIVNGSYGSDIKYKISLDNSYDYAYLEGEGKATIDELKLSVIADEDIIEFYLSGEIEKRKEYEEVIGSYPGKIDLFDLSLDELYSLYIGALISNAGVSAENLVE